MTAALSFNNTWKVLCADDDPVVHKSTAFALQGEVVEGKKVHLHTTSSAEQTIDFLRSNPDTVVLLLDVVMESPQAGLEAIQVIRKDLQMHNLRIIVRSGAPGLMGEYDAVKEFDISDWRPKNEMTQSKLMTSLTLAIRSYKELSSIEHRRAALDTSLSFLEQLSSNPDNPSLIPNILQALSTEAQFPFLLFKNTPWSGIKLRVPSSMQEQSQTLFAQMQTLGLEAFLQQNRLVPFAINQVKYLHHLYTPYLLIPFDTAHQILSQQDNSIAQIAQLVPLGSSIESFYQHPTQKKQINANLLYDQTLSSNDDELLFAEDLNDTLFNSDSQVPPISALHPSDISAEAQSIEPIDAKEIFSLNNTHTNFYFILSQYLSKPEINSVIRALSSTLTGRAKSREERVKGQLDALIPSCFNRLGFTNHILDNITHYHLTHLLIIVDFIGFSRINSSLGHMAGDRLLQEFHKRLSDRLPHFIPGRIASDSFAIIANQQQWDPKHLEELFITPFDTGVIPINLAARFSATKIDQQYSPDQMIMQAAVAQDYAKREDSTPFKLHWFNQQFETLARERVELSNKLFKALKKSDEFFMVFQPQIAIKDGKPIGAEALIRWRTEDGVFIGPDKFVPIAEQSGMADMLSNTAFRLTFEMIKKAKERGILLPKISVNLSPVEFENENLVKRIIDLTDSHGIDHQLIELELTETTAAKNPELMIRSLNQFKTAGYSLAIDDFGAGYSSLSLLAQLPVEKLKIDRAFIRALRQPGPQSGIAKLIVELGKTLGLKIVAEGVEYPEEAQALRVMGADSIQGWLYAKGMPTEELFKWLSEYQPKLY